MKLRFERRPLRAPRARRLSPVARLARARAWERAMVGQVPPAPLRPLRRLAYRSWGLTFLLRAFVRAESLRAEDSMWRSAVLR